ncbi:putative nuclease HARBI1 [Ostrea edulis]|uniref:putative nuclease HARBI1 n=1 Tax=Ostrea edulis TaxID=37623 RepID=UPI0024AFB461|nr:putative nuclease HARBI1 [Ostrea edulis]
MAARRMYLMNLMRIPRRMIKDRTNPLEVLSSDEIFQRYRFRSATILFICGLISEDLRHQTQISCPLLPLLQVLAALRFYATGSFYELIGDSLSISKSAVGRAVRAVTSLICSLSARYIKFPSQDEIPSIRTQFYELAGARTGLVLGDSGYGLKKYLMVPY